MVSADQQETKNGMHEITFSPKLSSCAAVPGGTEWGPQEVHDNKVGCVEII
jgi:hypothetical protein